MKLSYIKNRLSIHAGLKDSKENGLKGDLLFTKNFKNEDLVEILVLLLHASSKLRKKKLSKKLILYLWYICTKVKASAENTEITNKELLLHWVDTLDGVVTLLLRDFTVHDAFASYADFIRLNDDFAKMSLPFQDVFITFLEAYVHKPKKKYGGLDDDIINHCVALGSMKSKKALNILKRYAKNCPNKDIKQAAKDAVSKITS
jgi:hypothetical protein